MVFDCPGTFGNHGGAQLGKYETVRPNQDAQSKLVPIQRQLAHVSPGPMHTPKLYVRFAPKY
jgi:hypothetical protein